MQDADKVVLRRRFQPKTTMLSAKPEQALLEQPASLQQLAESKWQGLLVYSTA